MRISTLLFCAFTACNGDDTDTDADTSQADPTLTGAEFDSFTVNGAPSATVLTTETLSFEGTGTWWNSESCPECDGVVVVALDDEVVTCTNLTSPGVFPGGDWLFNGGAFAPEDDGTYEYSALVIEDRQCDTVQSSDLAIVADSATVSLTVELDDSLIVSSTAPANGAIQIEPHENISVVMNESIDVNRSATTQVVLSASGQTVPATVTFDGRFIGIDPVDDLDLRTTYVVTVNGIVGQSGAVLAAEESFAFSTVIVDPTATYVISSEQFGPGSVLGLETSSYTTLRMEPVFSTFDYPPQLWNIVVGDEPGAYQFINEWRGADVALQAASNRATPTMAVRSDASNQQWRLSSVGDGFRLSVIAHTDAAVLDAGGNTAGSPPALVGIGIDDGQVWNFDIVP